MLNLNPGRRARPSALDYLCISNYLNPNNYLMGSILGRVGHDPLGHDAILFWEPMCHDQKFE